MKQQKFKSVKSLVKALDNHEKVFWSNGSYEVRKDLAGQYLIIHSSGDTIGLFHQDGKGMNAELSELYTYSER